VCWASTFHGVCGGSGTTHAVSILVSLETKKLPTTLESSTTPSKVLEMSTLTGRLESFLFNDFFNDEKHKTDEVLNTFST
jgi:hypothetical protein